MVAIIHKLAGHIAKYQWVVHISEVNGQPERWCPACGAVGPLSGVEGDLELAESGHRSGCPTAALLVEWEAEANRLIRAAYAMGMTEATDHPVPQEWVPSGESILRMISTGPGPFCWHPSAISYAEVRAAAARAIAETINEKGNNDE